MPLPMLSAKPDAPARIPVSYRSRPSQSEVRLPGYELVKGMEIKEPLAHNAGV
jgi:hypothetical protein